MSLNDLLAEFGTRTGLGTLRCNTEGVCRILFDGEFAVDVEHAAGADEFHLSSRVAQLDPSLGPGFLARLLDANLMGKQTGGGALALDVLNDEIVLCRTLPAEGLSYRSFESALERFLAALEHWSDEVADAKPAREAESPSEETDLTIFRL